MSDGSPAGHAVGPTGPTGPTKPAGAQGSIGPTGAGGGSGAPGSPGYVAPPAPSLKTTAKPWQETPQGVGLTHGYDVMRTAFATTLPGQLKQLDLLAHKPIGG